MQRRAHRRAAARHPALLRRAVAGARRARPGGRRELAAGDVRLTMGGEPTFVVDRRHRRRRMEHGGRRPDEASSTPDKLIRRLRDRFAPGGLSTTARASGIPARSLPRWAFALYWRATASRSGATRPAADDRPRRLPPRRAAALRPGARARLGIAADLVIPALRGPRRLRSAQEHLLPANVDPRDSRLDDPRSARGSHGCSTAA